VRQAGQARRDRQALTVPRRTTGSQGPAGPPGSQGPGGSLSTFDTLAGLACTVGSASGTISLSYGAGGVATLTCVVSGGGGGLIHVAPSGDDADSGDAQHPLKTIQAAVNAAAAAHTDVLAAVGTYNESVSLVSNVQVTGGYDPASWTPVSSGVTTIVGGTQAIFAEGVTGATLQNMTLNAVLASGSTCTYGVREIGGSDLHLIDVTINADNAHDGAFSANGGNGPQGSTSPRPWIRTMRGGPSKAQSITQTRPFSRMCAAVSAPLPTWSSYATVRSSRTRRDPIGPFGDTFTCPPSPGAVATKNRRCRPIQAASFASMPSKSFPITHLVATIHPQR